MNENRLKNIGVKVDVWKKTKLLCASMELTHSELIDFLVDFYERETKKQKPNNQD